MGDRDPNAVTRRSKKTMTMHAALYDIALRPVERLFLRELRRRLVSTARGRVLEIGVGTGANLPFYPTGIELTGIDPDEGFLTRARQRAQALGRPVTLLAARAEALPFVNHSFDTVIATLVFCTVENPQQALQEVHRVLVPGGQFKLIEHVRVRNIVGAKVQDLLTPLWRRIANNCHLNRDTLSLVQSGGFRIDSVHGYLHGLILEIDARVSEIDRYGRAH